MHNAVNHHKRKIVYVGRRHITREEHNQECALCVNTSREHTTNQHTQQRPTNGTRQAPSPPSHGCTDPPPANTATPSWYHHNSCSLHHLVDTKAYHVSEASLSIFLHLCLLFLSLLRSLSLLLSLALSVSSLIFFSLPVCCTWGRGLTFTSAHVLVRALIDGPSYPPTDTGLPHVCLRPGTADDPSARHRACEERLWNASMICFPIEVQKVRIPLGLGFLHFQDSPPVSTDANLTKSLGFGDCWCTLDWRCNHPMARTPQR